MTSHLSIVTPVFNSFEDLRRLFDSLLPQLNGHEMVVVNDGSTDPRISDLLSATPKVKAIHLKHNQGSSVARNAGIREATGDRILFVDADCEAGPGMVARHLDFHKHYPKEGCLGRILPRSTKSLLLRYLDKGPSPMFGLEGIAPEQGQFLSYHFFYTLNSSVPRKTLIDAGLFDERYNAAWDDIELGYRMERGGFQMRFDREAVIYHRNPETFGRFFRRQIRVGRGYWLAHNHHPEMLGRLTFENQQDAFRRGLCEAWHVGNSFSEKAGFAVLEVLGRTGFWYGYIRAKSN